MPCRLGPYRRAPGRARRVGRGRALAGTGVRSGALLVALLVALAAVRADAAEHKPTASAAPKPATIDRNGVLILVRSTLLALDHANKTGNYTVLRDLGAPGFQVNTAARLAEIFAEERNDKLDLSGVAAIDPQLSLLPQVEANGFMHLAGFFPSVPKQVNFEMMFAPVEGQWRLFGLSVQLGQAAPTAPAETSAPPPPASSPQASSPPPATPRAAGTTRPAAPAATSPRAGAAPPPLPPAAKDAN